MPSERLLAVTIAAPLFIPVKVILKKRLKRFWSHGVININAEKTAHMGDRRGGGGGGGGGKWGEASTGENENTKKTN